MGKGETILVVDDDEAVRSLICVVLADQGYRVVQADSGEAAERLAMTHEHPIDLLVTDVVMPGMGGRVLAQRLRARHAGLKVLFVSGYVDDERLLQEVRRRDCGQGLINKPFLLADMVSRVRRVLGS